MSAAMNIMTAGHVMQTKYFVKIFFSVKNREMFVVVPQSFSTHP